MEAIKKQAHKLREQVAKQQQAVLKHLANIGHEGVVVDEAELQCHEQLQKLYNSTRAAKHLQRNIVRGIEGYISVSLKQMEIVRKLAEDCCKYGTENQSSDTHIAKVALNFGTSHNLMENERETLLGIIGDQVSEPLRALITGAPLEDARHLTHRYEKLRQEVESQAAEVLKRRSKIRESEISAESASKLRSAESRLTELKSTVAALGREANAAMLSVEAQQQQITFQRLFSMVDAEKTYHQHVLAILEKLYAEMVLEEQLDESSSPSASAVIDASLPRAHQNAISDDSDRHVHSNQNDEYFIGKVIHPFDAQADGELSLSIDDYVVVRQVAPTGWSEGECKGKAGWFPSAYVERQMNAPANMIMEPNSSSPQSLSTHSNECV